MINKTNLVRVNNDVESRGQSYQEVTDLDDNLPPQRSIFYWTIAQYVITLLTFIQTFPKRVT